MPKVFKSRVVAVAGSLAYVGLLTWAYPNVVSPSFAYLGYVYNRPDVFMTIVSLTLAVLPAAVLPVKVERPSHVVQWILYLLVLVPSMLIPPATITANPGGLLAFQCTIVLSFIALQQLGRVKPPQLPKLRYKGTLLTVLTLLILSITYIWMIRTFGLRLSYVPVSYVYDTRAEYKDMLSQAPALLGYLIVWTANVVNPLLMIMGLEVRSPLLVAGALVGQYLIYSTSGLKSAFFSALAVGGLWYFMKSRPQKFGRWAAWGMTFLVLISLSVPLMNSLFVRRLIITPGLLTGYYYDFFTTHPKALLGNSILAPFVAPRYDVAPPDVIGYVYFKADTHANANLWADAFANFGYVGILTFTVVLAAVLWVYDGASAGKEFAISAPLLVVPSVALSNAALFTSLLTHGFGLATVIIYLLPSRVSREGRRVRL